jgi:flagellar biosynthetic protein FliR
MISLMGPLVTESQNILWQGFIVFLRVGAVMAVLPAFGEQSVPQRVKLALALAFTMIVTTALSSQAIGTAGPFGSMMPYLMTEPIIGLALGLGFRLFVVALQTAGVIVAQALSLSQILGGAGVDPMPALGQVLVIAGLALAVMAGLHVQVARAMILSYDVLPAGQFPRPGDLSAWGVDRIARSFTLAFSLAAPFVIVSLLYNLTLGVINRAMPQLMVAFVGAPVITLGGLVLLMLLAPLMLSVWIDALGAFSVTPSGQSQ